MIKCNSGLAADYVLQDKNSDKMSIIGIVGQINSFIYPTYYNKLDLFFRLSREKKDKSKIDCRLVFRLDGVKQKEMDLKGIDFQSKLLYNLVINVSGIKLDHPGNFEVVLYYGNKKLYSYPMKIKRLSKND